MVMTRAQWEALQRRLPAEDRQTYEEYLVSTGAYTYQGADIASARYTAAAQAAGLTPTTTVATSTYTPDPQDVRDPVTGLTPAQAAAKKNAEELAASLGVNIDPNTGMIIKPPSDYVIDPATGKFVPPKPKDKNKTVVRTYFEGSGKNRVKVTVYSDGTETREPAPVDDAKTPVRSEYLGTGANRILRTYYSDGSYTDTPAPEITNTGVGDSDSATANLIASLQAQNASIMAQMQAAQRQAQLDAQAAAEAEQQQKRQSALVALTDRFNRYGLASLVPKIRELISSGASEDTIALQLQDTEEYKQRFIANQDRLKKGLAVLDPGTYIGLEDRYRQILRAYGLKQFDNDAYVTQFLANDVSPEELSSRVVTAVQRVQNADPAVSGMLKQFYGIGTTDMVAYVLDPTQQFPKIERQVAAAEIGVAAARQGLTAGVNVAEQLAAQGITQAEAQRGYSTIANILPQATKLSEIYTDVLDQYGQAEAEQEVFNRLASAQRKRQRLTEREIAAFTGQSGLGRGALGSPTGGQI
jgi:hypothetical protein